MLFDFPLSFQAFATMILIQVHCPTVIYYYQNYLKAVRLRYFRLGGRKGENKAAGRKLGGTGEQCHLSFLQISANGASSYLTGLHLSKCVQLHPLTVKCQVVALVCLTLMLK